MLHGPERDAVELSFELPATCALQLADGTADIGLVPVGALLDTPLAVFRGTGIACRGPVRSILMISRVPFGEVRQLALDASSRTSVLLARIVLLKRYGVKPQLISMKPDLLSMLDRADACLIIGDPALALDPEELRRSGFHVADLGDKWIELTRLPMVFAVWAGRSDLLTPEREKMFLDSWRFGMDHMEDIIAAEHQRRGITPELAREYLTGHIAFDLGAQEYAGMDLFLKYATELLEAEAPKTAAL
jgi:predicted solute-binding protein